jgi:hypothetical protein
LRRKRSSSAKASVWPFATDEGGGGIGVGVKETEDLHRERLQREKQRSDFTTSPRVGW